MNKLGIINLALGKLGQSLLSEEDTSDDKYNFINAIYDHYKYLVEASHAWKFCMKRAAIAVDETAPAFGFTYRYALPDDFLRLIRLNDALAENTDLYSIEGAYILTDMGTPLNIIYLAENDDESSYPSYFDEMLACRIAYESCEHFKQEANKKQVLMQEYGYNLKEARHCNMIQTSIMSLPLSATLKERLAGW